MTCSCADLPVGLPSHHTAAAIADRPDRSGRFRRLAVGVCALVLLALTGCANIPLPKVDRVVSRARVAPPDSPLASIARDIALPEKRTAVWPLVQAGFALDARLAAIASATTSIDIQSYRIADDSIGRLVLRALRDAALHGVRVRLLVDDLYTADMDRRLLGLAATPNVEVRLFNPVITARSSSLRRLIALAIDFKRLNHRMHNKLFIVDGALAVVGGRNLADEYFLRGSQGNFIDFDLLMTGAVVPQLSGWFDLYWNSDQVFPVEDIVRASGIEPDDRASRQADFDRVTRELPGPRPPTHPPAADFYGAPPFSQALGERRFRFVVTDAESYADSPTKIVARPASTAARSSETLTHRFLTLIGTAKEQVLMLSPYFIPGDEAMARIRQLRAAGVEVVVVTNSLAVSDEPLVNIRLGRHQTELLEMGVHLYELSSNRLKLDSSLRGLLGSSTGRLHAKLALVDHTDVFLGSMNLDPRSSTINTEIGVRVESQELVQMIVAGYKVDTAFGLYRVRLRPDGNGVEWTAINEGSTEELQLPPDTTFWQRVHLLLLSWFVPENEL